MNFAIIYVTNSLSRFVQVYISGGGQHNHVKLYVYFKLDNKFGYEFRRVLLPLHCFASEMILAL